MTEQEIDLCRQAGIIIYPGDQPRLIWQADFMEALPKLIELSRASGRQAEREECAKVRLPYNADDAMDRLAKKEWDEAAIRARSTK